MGIICLLLLFNLVNSLRDFKFSIPGPVGRSSLRQSVVSWPPPFSCSPSRSGWGGCRGGEPVTPVQARFSTSGPPPAGRGAQVLRGGGLPRWPCGARCLPRGPRAPRAEGCSSGIWGATQRDLRLRFWTYGRWVCKVTSASPRHP